MHPNYRGGALSSLLRFHARHCRGLLLLCAACGEGAEPGEELAESGAPAIRADDAGALAPNDASVSAALPDYDAAITTVRDCKAGTYAGEFMCIVDDVAPWAGKMSFKLEQRGSADLEISTLYISPDTVLIGMDDIGGMFKAEMKGSVDCATGKLSGSLDNGRYMNLLLDLSLAGALSGAYDATSTPSFSGKMGPLKSPDLDFGGLLSSPMATCTWSAKLE